MKIRILLAVFLSCVFVSDAALCADRIGPMATTTEPTSACAAELLSAETGVWISQRLQSCAKMYDACARTTTPCTEMSKCLVERQCFVENVYAFITTSSSCNYSMHSSTVILNQSKEIIFNTCAQAMCNASSPTNGCGDANVTASCNALVPFARTMIDNIARQATFVSMINFHQWTYDRILNLKVLVSGMNNVTPADVHVFVTPTGIGSCNVTIYLNEGSTHSASLTAEAILGESIVAGQYSFEGKSAMATCTAANPAERKLPCATTTFAGAMAKRLYYAILGCDPILGRTRCNCLDIPCWTEHVRCFAQEVVYIYEEEGCNEYALMDAEIFNSTRVYEACWSDKDAHGHSACGKVNCSRASMEMICTAMKNEAKAVLTPSCVKLNKLYPQPKENFTLERACADYMRDPLSGWNASVAWCGAQYHSCAGINADCGIAGICDRLSYQCRAEKEIATLANEPACASYISFKYGQYLRDISICLIDVCKERSRCDKNTIEQVCKDRLALQYAIWDDPNRLLLTTGIMKWDHNTLEQFKTHLSEVSAVTSMNLKVFVIRPGWIDIVTRVDHNSIIEILMKAVDFVGAYKLTNFTIAGRIQTQAPTICATLEEYKYSPVPACASLHIDTAAVAACSKGCESGQDCDASYDCRMDYEHCTYTWKNINMWNFKLCWKEANSGAYKGKFIAESECVPEYCARLNGTCELWIHELCLLRQLMGRTLISADYKMIPCMALNSTVLEWTSALLRRLREEIGVIMNRKYSVWVAVQGEAPGVTKLCVQVGTTQQDGRYDSTRPILSLFGLQKYLLENKNAISAMYGVHVLEISETDYGMSGPQEGVNVPKWQTPVPFNNSQFFPQPGGNYPNNNNNTNPMPMGGNNNNNQNFNQNNDGMVPDNSSRDGATQTKHSLPTTFYIALALGGLVLLVIFSAMVSQRVRGMCRPKTEHTIDSEQGASNGVKAPEPEVPRDAPLDKGGEDTGVKVPDGVQLFELEVPRDEEGDDGVTDGGHGDAVCIDVPPPQEVTSLDTAAHRQQD